MLFYASKHRLVLNTLNKSRITPLFYSFAFDVGMQCKQHMQKNERVTFVSIVN